MQTRSLCLTAVALVLALGGCGRIQETLALQQGLTEEFGTEDVTISLSGGGELTIQFTNWPAEGEGSGQRERTARQAAEYVRDNYPRFDSLSAVLVSFGWEQGGVTTTEEPFRFTAAELRSPASEAAADTSGQGDQPPN
jgi:hypothetical protein